MRADQGRGEVAVAAGLLGVALYVVVSAMAMPAGTSAQPGPGMLPMGFSICLGLAAIGVAIHGFRSIGTAPPVVFPGLPVIILALLSSCVLAFETVGFPLAALSFVALLFWMVGKIRPIIAIASAAIVVAACWFLFVRLLGVQLPLGLLPAY